MHVSVSRDMIINGAIVNRENVAFFKHYNSVTTIFVEVNSRLLLKAQVLNIHTTALYHKVKLKA